LAPVSLLLLLLATTQSSPAQELERGKIAFGRAEYARTIEILRPLLYPEPRLESESSIVDAHRMLGYAHLFERQNEQAAQEFRRLLQLRPDFRLDPLIDPPLVVDFFNGILKQQEGELAELERKRREAEAEERRRMDAIRNGPAIIERRYLRNSLAVSLLPFGAGQFQNGQRGKGWFFLTTESVFAGVSVAALTTNFALYGLRPRIQCKEAPVPTMTTTSTAPTTTSRGGSAAPAVENGCSPGFVPNGDQDRSKLLLKVQVISGGLFFAMAAWGIVDALVNFRDETPLPASPVPAAKAGQGHGLKLGVLSFGAGSVGGGLSFRF
jgi:hypothetical protein